MHLGLFRKILKELPSLETITRARRKIQAETPRLQAVKEVKEERDNLEVQVGMEMVGMDDKGCVC